MATNFKKKYLAPKMWIFLHEGGKFFLGMLDDFGPMGCWESDESQKNPKFEHDLDPHFDPIFAIWSRCAPLGVNPCHNLDQI